ncbi:hypothetical protein [Roseicella aquatilis]|uniref:Uncharacterized protein n=1 Tax=Roseicella aquatilis TaxID=2527868 RepID=A0A4R4D956_9PROT|nr:hypothetical protein [Roseicella aquatilis]TCZ56315.1 hypothetical protein EXY23_20250 [Roseicella aquatilis]
MAQTKRAAGRTTTAPPARRRASDARKSAEQREIEDMLESIQRRLDRLHAQADDLLKALEPPRGA